MGSIVSQLCVYGRPNIKRAEKPETKSLLWSENPGSQTFTAHTLFFFKLCYVREEQHSRACLQFLYKGTNVKCVQEAYVANCQQWCRVKASTSTQRHEIWKQTLFSFFLTCNKLCLLNNYNKLYPKFKQNSKNFHSAAELLSALWSILLPWGHFHFTAFLSTLFVATASSCFHWKQAPIVLPAQHLAN